MEQIAQSFVDSFLIGGPVLLILGGCIAFVWALFNVAKDYFTEGQTGRGLLSKLGEAVVVPALIVGGGTILALIPSIT